MVIARESARKEFKAADEEMQRALEAKLAALEERLKSVPGRLLVSKIWSAERVTYEGEFVCYDGALNQARKDTAQALCGSDWVCVARAGRDGCDGLTPNVSDTPVKHMSGSTSSRWMALRLSPSGIIRESAQATAGS
jgi:hypothetical protein